MTQWISRKRPSLSPSAQDLGERAGPRDQVDAGIGVLGEGMPRRTWRRRRPARTRPAARAGSGRRWSTPISFGAGLFSSATASPTPDPGATSKGLSPGALARRPVRCPIRGAKPSPDLACCPREQQAQKGRCRVIGRPKSVPPDVTRGGGRMMHQHPGCRVVPASWPERSPDLNMIGSGLGR